MMVVAGSLHDEELDQLARKARAGCSTSFAELARRVSPNLLNFLRQRSASIQDAEDLRQETLLKVYQNLASYDPSRPFGPWMMTIAARLAAGRARAGRPVEPLREDVAGASVDAEQEAARREAGAKLWAEAVRLLPAAQYRVLRLRYAEQLDVRAVATAAGVSMANAKVLLLRARRRLMASPQVRGLMALSGAARAETDIGGRDVRSTTPPWPPLGKEGSGQAPEENNQAPEEDNHAL